MKKIVLIISIIVLILFTGTLQVLNARNPADKSPQSWQNMNSVEDVCRIYPDRMKTILQSLNLDLKGLSEVKTAYEKNDIPLACELLLKYYKEGNSASFYRQSLQGGSRNRNSEADSILQNIFTFQLSTGKVPFDKEGHLDWTFKGPSNDIEWAWALNRHYHINTLLEAYLKTGNPDYAKTIDLHIKDWVIRSLPYPSRKSSTEMWRGLEVSFRVKAWARVFYSLINSEYISPATRLLMLSSIPEHAHYASNFHAQGNWLTMEMSGLATVASAWPEFKDSPSWLAYSKETMLKSMTDQVYPDGVQTELTSSYHQVALNNFSLFADICQKTSVILPDTYKDYIEKMWNYLAFSMRPDGYGLLNNDADLIFNRESIEKTSLKDNRKDWQYIATNGAEGLKPKGAPSIIFPWAGQLIMRSGYEPDAQWGFFDIGPWGTGHQHNDKLHLSIFAYGRDLLVDAGRFAYRGEIADKFRGYATGSYGHNVILIDSKGQEPGPKSTDKPLTDQYYKISDKFDYAWGSFNRYVDLKGECSHTRSVFYVRGKFWVVLDNISTDRPRKIETLWHFHPDNKVIMKKNNIISTDNKYGNLQIIPVGDMKWNVSIIKGQESPSPQGWYSEEYNNTVPNPVSIYSEVIDKTSSMIWILYSSAGTGPEIKSKILSKDENGVRLRVEIMGDGRWEIVVPFSDSSKATMPVSPGSDGKI